MKTKQVLIPVVAFVVGITTGHLSQENQRKSMSLRQEIREKSQQLRVENIRWSVPGEGYKEGSVVYAKSGEIETRPGVRDPDKEFIQVHGTVNGQDFLAYYQSK